VEIYFSAGTRTSTKKNTVLILHTVYTNYITNFLLFVPTYGNKILNVFRVVL